MNIQTLLEGLFSFLNYAVLPFLVVIAFIIFLWGIARYFIIGAGNKEDQEKAKRLAFWGILAFVIISSLWGIVNLFAEGLGLVGTDPILPDYMEENNTQ